MKNKIDLFNLLSTDQYFLSQFCDIIKDELELDFDPNIHYSINQYSISFFLSSSSILQIIPDNDLGFTYGNAPLYEKIVKRSIDRICLSINRDNKLESILNKKESF